MLICGATGFIGTNLILKFKNKYNVVGIYNKRKPNFKYKIKWIKCDLRNFKDCLKVTKNVDLVIQAAATTSGSKDILSKPYIHVTDNAIMNSYLLKACFINKIKQFIFTSCTVMYGNSKRYLDEKEVYENKIFKSYYGVANTKLYIEKMCKFFSNISNIKFSIIRHSNIYGPHDKFDIEKGHFIGSSIKKIFDKSNEFKMYGKGMEKRDFLYIDDLLDFLEIIIKRQKNKFEIYNCSYGKSFKIIEVLKKILHLSKKNKKIVRINNKNINVNILVSNNKAKKLKWFPKTNLDNGLKQTINWYKKNEKIF